MVTLQWRLWKRLSQLSQSFDTSNNTCSRQADNSIVLCETFNRNLTIKSKWNEARRESRDYFDMFPNITTWNTIHVTRFNDISWNLLAGQLVLAFVQAESLLHLVSRIDDGRRWSSWAALQRRITVRCPMEDEHHDPSAQPGRWQAVGQVVGRWQIFQTGRWQYTNATSHFLKYVKEFEEIGEKPLF